MRSGVPGHSSHPKIGWTAQESMPSMRGAGPSGQVGSSRMISLRPRRVANRDDPLVAGFHVIVSVGGGRLEYRPRPAARPK
jgi:hypothetical protein